MLTAKEKRKLSKMKKKINELFILGEITQEEADAMAAGDLEIPGTSNGNNTSEKVEENFKDNNNLADIAAINKKLTQAREQRKPGPMLNLTLERLGGNYLSHQEIRDLVHFSVIGPVVAKPKWAFFRPWKSTSQTVLIRVNCTKEYIENNEHSFNFVDNFFQKKWIRMHKNVGERVDFWKNMIRVPVSLQEQIREKIIKLKDAETEGQEVSKILKKELMMTAPDMVENDYPWPVGGNICTKDRYKPVTVDSPIFFLDCEMCKTDTNVSELTRISLIREDGSVVFDTLVKPHNEITDYVTKFSGITPEMLEDVDVRLSDVQKAIRAVLPPDAIICGHSLEFDLKALKMCHPYCIDIGLVYNISGNRRIKTALRTLVYIFLGKDIQNSTGHCSVEDSYATLELYRMKTEHGLLFGNVEFGWNYDDWNKKKDEEMRARIDEEMKKAEAKEEVSKKKRRVEIQPIICQCGRKINIECIVEHCRCLKSPASKCIFCLGDEEPTPSEDGWIDWGSSLLKDTGEKYRSLAYYLTGGQHDVMLGYKNCKDTQVDCAKIYTIQNPSSYLTQEDYIKEVAANMLQYKLAMVELDYTNREDELLHLADGDEEGEEGEILSVMPMVVSEMDAHISKIVKSAAKYSLVILVLASPSASVCYLKVKQ